MNQIPPSNGIPKVEFQEANLPNLPQDVLLKNVLPHLDKDDHKKLRACCRALKHVVDKGVKSVDITPSNFQELLEDPLKFPATKELRFLNVPGLLAMTYTNNLPPTNAGAIKKLQLDKATTIPSIALPNLRQLTLKDSAVAPDFALNNAALLETLHMSESRSAYAWLNKENLQGLREISISSTASDGKPLGLTDKANLTKLSALNSDIKEIHLPSSGRLQELHLTGLPLLRSELNLASLLSLKTIAIKDAKISALALPETNPVVESLHLERLDNLHRLADGNLPFPASLTQLQDLRLLDFPINFQSLNLLALTKLTSLAISNLTIGDILLPQNSLKNIVLTSLPSLHGLNLAHQSRLKLLFLDFAGHADLSELTTLTQLEVLHFSNAQSHSLALDLSSFTNIRFLLLDSLSNSSLLLPQSTALNSLSLKDLRHMPAVMDLTHRTNLTSLALIKSPTREINFPLANLIKTMEFFDLPNLIGHLNLSHFSNLESLNLSACHMSGITLPEYGKLKNLELILLQSVTGNLDLNKQAHLVNIKLVLLNISSITLPEGTIRPTLDLSYLPLCRNIAPSARSAILSPAPVNCPLLVTEEPS